MTSLIGATHSVRRLSGVPAVPGRIAFALGTIVLDVLVIVSAAILTGTAYHVVGYGGAGHIDNYVTVGGLAALCFVLPFLFRNAYRVEDYVDSRRGFSKIFVVWNTAFLCLALIGFLTKTTGIFSRGWLILFYFTGLAALSGLTSLVGAALHSLIKSGRIASRRVMLLGSADEVARIAEGIVACRSGVRVAAVQDLPPPASSRHDTCGGKTLDEALASAVEKARFSGVEDVVLLADWCGSDLVEKTVQAFSATPVSVHLGASGLIGRVSQAQVSHFGTITAVSVTQPPLNAGQRALKRSFDVVVAALALVLLSPILALIAMAIRMTSPGPVFFRQRRRGYNSQEFRIWKFRTMSTLDDGDHIKQATPNDARVTRLGQYLRRYNLDELPQLLNVVRGEMSLVGPRPHAVAHDRHYETRIGSYPRRLNVKPGITGWAQVNGLRGRTETEEAMRARVEYDIYYIDNWSIFLDVYILVLTVISQKAYRNAH